MNFRVAERRRVLCFDLESRPIAFWFGDKTTAQITAFGWKWEDEPEAKAMLLRADGRFTNIGKSRVPLSAEQAYERFVRELEAAGLVYGHNVRRFDLPLLQAGLLRLQLEPLPVLLTTDTLRDYPKRKDMSASLASFASMYGLSEKGKLSLTTVDWEQANQLTPEGLELARERVCSDVLLQERLRNKLLSLGLLAAPRVWRP